MKYIFYFILIESDDPSFYSQYFTIGIILDISEFCGHATP